MADFELKADGEGKPALYYEGDHLGHLAKGRSLIAPLFQPVRAVGALEGDALRDVVTRCEAWIAAQLEKHLGGIVALYALSQDASVDGNVRALAVQLAEEGGIAGRGFVSDALRALPKEARGAARKGGIVFGALDIYHHAALKPAAAKWRAALFAARDERVMPDMPPESAVHLKEWNFSNQADCRNAGYRKIGEEYLRIDLAERVIKKAHKARGEATDFALDMTFATSLGISETGLNALMRDAGFRKADAPVVEGKNTENPTDCHPREGGDPSPEAKVETDDSEKPQDQVMDSRLRGNDKEGEGAQKGEEVAQADEEEGTQTNEAATQAAPTPEASAPPEPVLTYWRWAGMRQAKPQGQRPRHAAKGKGNDGRGAKGKRPRSEANRDQKPEAVPPSALALQLAALQEQQASKSGK